MQTYLQKFLSFLQDEEGASAIEYALLVALIALAITAGATTLGTKIGDVQTPRKLARNPLLKSGPKSQGFGPCLTGETSLAHGRGLMGECGLRS